ncbi:MAG: gliding motility lipoprotein GldD [Bacteroidales bacterium]
MLIITLLILLAGCGENYFPKPPGYFRIDLPEKEYTTFDSCCPFTFEYPVYSQILFDTSRAAERCWMNLNFPDFRGTIHLSYKPVSGNLNEYTEDSRTLALKHIPKSSGISTVQYTDTVRHVYGLVYQIAGSETASPCQFYVTDSTRHFIRGALYFNTVPNNDSLQPVIRFIREDIDHLLETIRWE